jgi:hypothetical protein
MDRVIKEKSGQKDLEDLDLDEIDRLLEEELDDDRVMEEYRRKRMAEMNAQLAKEKFGSVGIAGSRGFGRRVPTRSSILAGLPDLEARIRSGG